MIDIVVIIGVLIVIAVYLYTGYTIIYKSRHMYDLDDESDTEHMTAPDRCNDDNDTEKLYGSMRSINDVPYDRK